MSTPSTLGSSRPMENTLSTAVRLCGMPQDNPCCLVCLIMDSPHTHTTLPRTHPHSLTGAPPSTSPYCCCHLSSSDTFFSCPPRDASVPFTTPVHCSAFLLGPPNRMNYRVCATMTSSQSRGPALPSQRRRLAILDRTANRSTARLQYQKPSRTLAYLSLTS